MVCASDGEILLYRAFTAPVLSLEAAFEAPQPEKRLMHTDKIKKLFIILLCYLSPLHTSLTDCSGNSKESCHITILMAKWNIGVIMKRSVWDKFVKLREDYRNALLDIEKKMPQLKGLQQELIDERSSGKTGNSLYTVETPIVFNGALDDVNIDDDIRMILVGDNPGRREQAAVNRRYLVGPSGKIAEKFFRDNPSLRIDFRRNVIILNKTPVHTPRTTELRELCRLGGLSLEQELSESQRLMARLLFEFHQALNNAGASAPLKVWITGYSEMRKGGIFEVYTDTLRDLYLKNKSKNLAANVLIYRHFSMNQFTIDLRQRSVPGKSLVKNLEDIGTLYRHRILGF